MKKIITFTLLVLALILVARLVYAQVYPGSNQFAPDPDNGEIMTTDGSFGVWSSPSSLCEAITGSADLCDGSDDGAGGGSGWATTSADYWAQNDLILTEISDVDGSPSTNDLLVWDGDSWNNYATTSANLGFVDFSDLHDAVTLAGSLDYLTISGQILTRNAIDLTTDVAGVLPDDNVADNITASNYLSLSAWYATTTDQLTQGSTNLYNQTHTGEVTGATALTIANNIIEEANLEVTNSAVDNYILSYDSGTGGFTWVQDQTGAGGGGTGTVGTSTVPTVGEIPYWTDNGTPSLLGSVATGTLSESATGLEFNASRFLIGGSATLSLTSGYEIPLTASTTEWDTAFSWGDHATEGYLTTVDISDDTNLTGDSEIVLTNDTLSIASSIARDSELHSAVTVTDSSEIDLALTGQDLTASLIAGSIDETKLDTSTNASLDLADSSAQSGDNISIFTNDSGYLTGNQTITLSGDVTGSGATAITTALSTNSVSDNEIDYTTVTLNDLTFDVGSVSKTEYGYLNGVTSAIQTQLNAKLETVDISTDTNLAGGTNLTLSGDTMNLDDTITLTGASTTHASTTSFTFGGVTGTAWSDFCVSITGGSGLCDGSDDGAGGGSTLHVDGGGFVYPQTGDYHSAPYYQATSSTESLFAGGFLSQASSTIIGDITLGGDVDLVNNELNNVSRIDIKGIGATYTSLPDPYISWSGTYNYDYANLLMPQAVNFAGTHVIEQDGFFLGMGFLFNNQATIKNVSGENRTFNSFYSLGIQPEWQADNGTVTHTQSIDIIVQPKFIGINGGTYNLTRGVGQVTRAEARANATITDYTAQYIQGTFGTGAATNQIGLAIADLTHATNNTDLYLGAPSFSSLSAPSGNYAIYQNNSKTNLFNGPILAENSLEIPNGTNPTVNATGEMALDTTDNQLLVADSGGTARVFGKSVQKIWSTTVASTSIAFTSNGLLKVPTELDGYAMFDIRCSVQGGTSKIIAVEDESGNSTENITCGTSVTSDDGSITNATVTAGEEMYIDFGATSGAVDYVSISVFGRWTRE